VLTIKDEEPRESVDDIWASAAQMATVGIFVILLGICLYVCRPILLPVAAAIVIGTTLAPLVKAAARYRASPWLSAGILAAAGPDSCTAAKQHRYSMTSSRVRLCAPLPLRFNPGYNSNCARAASSHSGGCRERARSAGCAGTA
jgi:hypothetical protein